MEHKLPKRRFEITLTLKDNSTGLSECKQVMFDGDELKEVHMDLTNMVDTLMKALKRIL